MKKTIISILILGWLATTVSANNWWENINLKGDFRYRHEMTDEENSETRNRHRIRAWVGMFAKANETFDIGFQLATGSSDPVSTNQSLDDAFSTKNFGLDMAYLTYSNDNLPGFQVTAGKFKNRFYKPGESELIWDSDWNPEGIILNYNTNLKNMKLELIGAGLWIEEREDDKDSWIGAIQSIAGFKVNRDKGRINIGLGYFNVKNSKGFNSFYDSRDPKGNSFVSVGQNSRYINEFELLELMFELSHQLSDGLPIVLMADYVSNLAADSLKTGWLFGARFGKAAKPGGWDVRFIYRQLRKDAVIGAFTDSNFGGGGTDARGFEIGGAYQFADNAAFKIAYFANETDLEVMDQKSYKRLQLDLQLKFQ